MYESESESTRGVHKVRSLTQMDTRKLNDIMSQVTNNHRYLLAQVIIGVTYLWWFLARDSMLSTLYAIANPSVCLSVCPSVKRVDQSKTVEARIMQFSPYSSPIPLLFTI